MKEIIKFVLYGITFVVLVNVTLLGLALALGW